MRYAQWLCSAAAAALILIKLNKQFNTCFWFFFFNYYYLYTFSIARCVRNLPYIISSVRPCKINIIFYINKLYTFIWNLAKSAQVSRQRKHFILRVPFVYKDKIWGFGCWMKNDLYRMQLFFPHRYFKAKRRKKSSPYIFRGR